MKSLVAIPTYNERDNIISLIEGILSQGDDLDVLVIDDNSPDGTGDILDTLSREEDRVQVIHRAGRLGLGTAYVEAFRYTLAANYDAVITMDADFSHDPSYLPGFQEKLRDGYDMVVGTRNARGGGVRGWPLYRSLLSRGGSFYAQLILGLEVSDATGGFRALKRKVLKAIDWDAIKSSGYSFQIEVNFRVQQLGFRVGEVPIIFVNRTKGRSKMSRQIVLEALAVVWRLRLEHELSRQLAALGRGGADTR